MNAPSIATATLLAASLAAAVGHGRAQQPATPPGVVEDAAGTAVVAALQQQFQGRDVEFQLDALETERVSLRDLAVEGDGRIRIEGSGGWLPVKFEALYDRAAGTMLSPAITLDRAPVQAAPRHVAAAPTDGLDGAVTQALAREFAYQDVAFSLDRAWRAGGDARYAVVEATGVADFDGEGMAEVDVQGVYDAMDRRWVSVQYTLGGEPLPDAPAVAIR